MCRMFAAIGKGIPAQDLLLKFQKLAIDGKRFDPDKKGHHHGWGIVGKSINDPNFRYFGRSANDAGEDPEYQEAIQAISNNYDGIILAHLRQASEGLSISKDMNHPFLMNKLAFQHNGAVFFKEKPLNISKGMGIKKFDSEGRFISLEYKDFFFITAYFPNGGQGPERLQYKMDFYDAFLKYVEKLKTKKAVIFCGDVNTAHNEIDLARPKANEKNTGFLPMERAWLDKITKAGWLDTFRHFNKEPDNYTWWDYKTRARERNVGWRLDYFFINSEAKNKLKKAFILKNTMGSDHCPLGIELSS